MRQYLAVIRDANNAVVKFAHFSCIDDDNAMVAAIGLRDNSTGNGILENERVNNRPRPFRCVVGQK